MSLDIQDLGALGEFFGALFVAATLIYLSLQVKVAQRTTMAQIYQMRADAASLAAVLVGSSSELRQTMARYYQLRAEAGADQALQALDPDERNQLFWYMRGQLTRIDNIYFQVQKGLMDKDTFVGFEKQIRQDGPAWRTLGLLEYQRPGFRDMVEKVLAERDATA